MRQLQAKVSANCCAAYQQHISKSLVPKTQRISFMSIILKLFEIRNLHNVLLQNTIINYCINWLTKGSSCVFILLSTGKKMSCDSCNFAPAFSKTEFGVAT